MANPAQPVVVPKAKWHEAPALAPEETHPPPSEGARKRTGS